jgi:hypothetical protein
MLFSEPANRSMRPQAPTWCPVLLGQKVTKGDKRCMFPEPGTLRQPAPKADALSTRARPLRGLSGTGEILPPLYPDAHFNIIDRNTFASTSLFRRAETCRDLDRPFHRQISADRQWVSNCPVQGFLRPCSITGSSLQAPVAACLRGRSDMKPQGDGILVWEQVPLFLEHLQSEESIVAPALAHLRAGYGLGFTCLTSSNTCLTSSNRCSQAGQQQND